MRRIALIVNPRAGNGRGRSAGQEALAAIEALGARGTAVETRHARHAAELARLAAQDHDTVACVGGDGTIGEVLEGIVEASQVTLGIVPVGTANVMARELRIPFASAAAAAVLVNGARRSIDFARARGRPLLANCGVGFESEVVRRIHLLRRASVRRGGSGRLSKSAYVWPALRELARHHPPRLRLWVDGRELPGPFSSIVISNTRNYGGVMCVTPAARYDDGLLDVVARRGTGYARLVRGFLCAILGRCERETTALYMQGADFKIESDARCAAQIDGDAAGMLPPPLEVRIGERQIAVWTPKEKDP
jgi:diacylglycerol kinase (ATP)